MPKRILTLFVLTILIIPINVYAQKVEFKDGIKNIHNEKPKWGDNPKVKLEFVRQIGELEGDDENYAFFNPIEV